jgi:hypothetical protein
MTVGEARRSRHARAFTAPRPLGRWVSAVLVMAMMAVDTPARALVDVDPDLEPGPIEPDPDDTGSSDPATFTWRMPSRFTDENNDGLLDYMTPSDFCTVDDASGCSRRPKTSPFAVAPASWRANLDACASALAEGDDPTFTWRLLRSPGTITGGPGCSASVLTVPAEGTYAVELTVSSSLGTATVTHDVVVQDWLIVSLGDSYGSGEGNPDVEMGRGLFGEKTSDAVWQDRRCHRTAQAGSAQAARWLELADPRTSVTFLHIACSGAEALNGLLSTYSGLHGTWEANHMAPLDPQITQARELVAGREIDALYLSIGGNDAKFANLVMSCVALAPCNPRAVGVADGVYPDVLMVAGVCGGIGAITPFPLKLIAVAVCVPVLSNILATFAGDTAENHFQAGLRGGTVADGDFANYRLIGIYNRLRDSIHATAPLPNGDPYLGLPTALAARVFISEYVDATQDDEGDYCPKGDLLKPFNDTRIPGLGREEYEWLDVGVERKLNAAIAHYAQDKGWTLVDGIHARYAKHGICADDSYLVGLLTESLWRQDDINGTAHPNVAGHRVYRDRILSKLLPSLYPGADPLDVRTFAHVTSWVSKHAPRLPAQAPVSDAGGPYQVAEGSSVAAVNRSFDDGPLTFGWESGDDAIASVAPPTATTPTITGVDDGSTTVTLLAIDDAGNVAPATAAVTVTNVAPTVHAEPQSPIVLAEGDTLTTTVTYTDPGPRDSHTATVSSDHGTTAEQAASGGSVAVVHRFGDDEPGISDDVYQVDVTVRDDDGGSGTDSFPVTVSNVAPSVAPVVVPLAPQPLGTAITAASSYSDPGADDHTVTWDWGDSTTTVEPRGVNVDGAISAAHLYTAAGLYTVSVTVDDHDGGVTTETVQYVVVYDASGGFVTGAGVVQSPAGALVDAPAAIGPVTFAFISKYQRGATVPVGKTKFRFQAGDFVVDSTSYDWLVVTGAGKAQYRGSATVNGQTGYRFMLSVVDGDRTAPKGPDRLRLEVRRTGDGSVVYDNQMGAVDDTDASTTVTGGQITVTRGRPGGRGRHDQARERSRPMLEAWLSPPKASDHVSRLHSTRFGKLYD